MEISGRVVRIDPAEIWMDVQAERPRCGGCAKSGDCGMSSAGSGGATSQVIRLAWDKRVAIDGSVAITIVDGQLLRGALYAYLIPLGIGFIGAILAEPIWQRMSAMTAMSGGEWLAPAGFLAGIALGILHLRVADRRGLLGGVRLAVSSTTEILSEASCHHSGTAGACTAVEFDR